MEKHVPLFIFFLIVFCYLLLTIMLLFNSPSDSCRLVYHGVWIRDPPLLYIAKEPLPYNKLKNTFISGSIYLTSHVLIPPPHKLASSCHMFFPRANLIYEQPGHLSHYSGLPPLDIFLDIPYPSCIQSFSHQGPLPLSD